MDDASELLPGHQLTVRAWGETPMDALDNQIELVEQPVPSLEREDDVLIRVRSCAVGWVDLIMASGQYQHMAEPPYTPGLEFAGEVAAIGPNVDNVKVGDRVLADGFLTGPRSSGPHQRYGGMATYAVIPAAAALSLPIDLSFDEAVNLLGNFETAYHVLVVRARVQPDEVVLVHGASGSTGLAAVQLARHLGATVIATGRNPSKLAQISELGANATIQLTADDPPTKLRDDVKAITGGRGADVVYDGVGGPLSVASLRALTFGGRFCIVGWAATPNVAKGKGGRGAPNANQLPTNLIQMKGIDVLGCPAVIATKHDPTLRPTRLKWIWKALADRTIRPHVGGTYELGSYRDAFLAKWKSQHVGGCVLHL